jgi:hypothetical protein
MRDLFDQIVREGEPAIHQMIAEKRQETVDLEFKEKSNASTGEPNRDDRRVLGIALSALSNSIGGMLIWGVEAKKNGEQVDCAIAWKPINEIHRFKAELVRLLSQAIMPRHEGIKVEAVPASSPPGAGYLLVLVERSERRPHRCEFGEKQYFKRIGDSSIAMEHYDIEDSFKRMTVPELTLQHSVSPARVEGDRATVIVELMLQNDSTVTARFPYLGLEEIAGATWVPAEQRGIIPRKVTDVIYFDGAADQVIHPDTSMVIAVLQQQFSAVPQYDKVRVTPRQISFRYRTGCLNSRQKRGEVIIPSEELVTGMPGT